MTHTPSPPRYVRALGYEEARLLLDACLRKASDMGVPASVAVLDGSRELAAFGRQDHAPLLTADVAVSKAYTSVSLRQPSGALAEATAPDGAFFGLAEGASRGIITFAGGFPLFADGDVIGAIGASGGSLAEDEAIARAGVDLFEGWSR